MKTISFAFLGLIAALIALPPIGGIATADGLPPEMVSVPAGTFTMGRRDDGDDKVYGSAIELPRRMVTLSAYQIGKYEEAKWSPWRRWTG